MAEIKKILGQSNPAATTGTVVYTVPDLKGAVISSIIVCNQAGAGTFRVYVTYGGNSTTTIEYLYYDTAIAANESREIKCGITLSNADFISVYASSATMSFNIFGAEFDQENVYLP